MSFFLKETLVFSVLICFLAQPKAEIITDGSLSPTQNISLNNNEYTIIQDLGKIAGNNLFHSFQEFNLDAGETATFSGNGNIQNVISRVTGGNPSNINGTIRNTIPHANTYLINPSGILFGEYSKLDVQGGFHASNADYVKMQDDSRFYTGLNQDGSSLSISAPASFGFLDNPHGKISVMDSGEVNEQLESGLQKEWIYLTKCWARGVIENNQLNC